MTAAAERQIAVGSGRKEVGRGSGGKKVGRGQRRANGLTGMVLRQKAGWRWYFGGWQAGVGA